MAFAKIIPFDRPLTGAVLPGQGRAFTEAELNAKVQEGYRRGVDSARAAADQQMVELRSEMEQLSHGVLEKLAGVETLLLAQIREALPALAVDLAHRLMAGWTPPPELLERLCREALEQLFPERDGLELSLAPEDATLLQSLNPDWLQRYPGLRIRADETLARGDCVVRSRFGLTDARQATKLASLSRGLTGA